MGRARRWSGSSATGGPARAARHRPGRAAAARRTRAARAGPAGARRRPLRGDHAARPRATTSSALRALLAGSRVVSIVGPGGLGKTRLAHVLAREAAAAGRARRRAGRRHRAGGPRRRGRLGAGRARLGQRPACADRRAARRRPRPDRPAASTSRPSLLVLDNCEHLVEAVADLVAFLVSTTAELRVLTTTRAPLAIAAEHVYLLGRAGGRRRGASCSASGRSRPGRRAPRRRGVVASIVARLDGLPLAIELAAAKVRVMAVEEIDRRLENRFALLRGGDRSAPDRHQTLLAVIDWSWNLLDDGERRALRRLSLFHDGFTLDAAEAVLGDGALDAVQGLVDQSLLTFARPRRRALPDARDRARVRPHAAGRRGRGRAGARRPPRAGRSRTRAARRAAVRRRAVRRDRRRCAPRRTTSPTCCAARSPTATRRVVAAARGARRGSGRSAASTCG